MKNTRNCLVSRKWENLDFDILFLIFSLLSDKELLFIVSLVCKSWKKVCWDMTFWKSREILDFTPLMHAGSIIYNIYPKPNDNSSLSVRWMKLMNRVMIEEHRVQFATTLIFGIRTCISDNHLLYVSDRTLELKKLYLQNGALITSKGFSRAIRNWQSLEEIFLGHISQWMIYVEHILQEIGINCKKLSVFKLDSSEIDSFVAVLISKNMKSLKELWLINSIITIESLKFLLSKCKRLEKLNIIRCKIITEYEEPEYYLTWYELIRKTPVDKCKFIKWAVAEEEESLYSPKDMVDSLLTRNNDDDDEFSLRESQ